MLMNNCYANYGSTNARELAALLADELAAFEPRGVAAGGETANAVPGFLPTTHGLRLRATRGRPARR